MEGKNPNQKYCHHCDTTVGTSFVKVVETFTMRDEVFENIDTEYMQCNQCGEYIADEALDAKELKKIANLYAARKGLQLSDIKEIRKHYALSADLFARILGWGKSTIIRYEKEEHVPSSAHMSILKSLKENPQCISNYFNDNKHRFSDKEQVKIEKKLEKLRSEMETNAVDEDNTFALERTLTQIYDKYAGEEVTGYNNFLMEKLINFVLFFAGDGVKKTKLMKLMFYADFLNYKRSALSISALPYIRREFGPVPYEHD
ncbi:MAG: type II TA system antitoxin MqsA family protein, partial [Bacilli bacterium]